MRRLLLEFLIDFSLSQKYYLRTVAKRTKHNTTFLIGIFLLLVVCVQSSNAFAQQPASFLMGEEQFRGIQIYDVIQDKSLNYWFATNEGIYLFNGITYERIECPKAKSNSAFNFVMDASGTIYCHNLNNQIFRIRDKQLTLFYELTEEEGGADISLVVLASGNVVVSSREIIVLSTSGKVIARKKGINHYIGSPLVTENGKIYYHFSHTDSLLIYANGQFSIKKITSSDKQPFSDGVFQFFRSGKQQLALNLSSKKLYTFDPAALRLKPLPQNELFMRSKSIRIYENSHGFWVAGTLPGVSHFKGYNSTSDEVIFGNYFISDVYEDHEGNILLSTFDKGILVIPDMKIPDVINRFEDDPVTSLYSDPLGDLILGSSQGKILRYKNNKLTPILNSGERPIDVIGGFPGSDWYFFDNGFINVCHRTSGKIVPITKASLKDVTFSSKECAYLGTNCGVYKVIHTGDNRFETTDLPSIANRVHFLEYDQKHQLLYVSTATGLVTMDLSGKTRHLYFRGKELFPAGVSLSEGNAYFSTKEDGILVYKNGKFVRQIIPVINQRPQSVKKLIVCNHTIIATTNDGFYQFDLNGKLLRSIGSEYGFSSNRVVDFTFHKGKLWVSHSGGVQQIDPRYKSPHKRIASVRIDKVFVNDQEIPFKNKQIFGSDERKFQFFFSVPTLRNRESISYHYRLLGNDNKWNTADYTARQISYNALAPGKYTLQIRIENQGKFSEIQSVSFSIASPLYAQWWFLLLAGLLAIGGIIYIYRWQLSIQRRKAERINELNASKLTAIQSQMNPHFIFNSLNSIQDLILKGDVEHSYSYITTFSNLVRRTLNYSEKDFIDFDQELKLLELYLSLEKLRFKKDFDYTIHTDQLEEDVMIPPLLIQPFVENALVHGLLHKEGEKRLSVSFHLEDVLICVIEDNGIGREAARAIRQRQRSDHESFSGKAIHRRFEILGNVFGGQFGYSYEDLSENGIPSGTRVTLRIPVKEQF